MLLRWRALEEFYCGLGPGLRGRGRCRFAGSQMSGDRKGGFGLGMFWGQGGGERRRRHEKSVSLRQGERCRPPLATNDLSGPAASSPILCLPSCHRSQGPVALVAHCSTSFFLPWVRTHPTSTCKPRQARYACKPPGSRWIPAVLRVPSHRLSLSWLGTGKAVGGMEGGRRRRWAKAVSPVPVPVPVPSQQQTREASSMCVPRSAAIGSQSVLGLGIGNLVHRPPPPRLVSWLAGDGLGWETGHAHRTSV